MQAHAQGPIAAHAAPGAAFAISLLPQVGEIPGAAQNAHFLVGRLERNESRHP